MTTENNSQLIGNISGDGTVNRKPNVRGKLIRRRNELWLAGCLTAFICVAPAKAQLSSSTSGGGETGGIPGGCNCLCPPNPPAGGCPYCDNGGGTTRCAESIG